MIDSGDKLRMLGQGSLFIGWKFDDKARFPKAGERLKMFNVITLAFLTEEGRSDIDRGHVCYVTLTVDAGIFLR